MLHYSLISEFGGGVVSVADSFDEHARQLSGALAGEDAEEGASRRRRSLEAFVRPHGLDRPAGEVMVDAIDGAMAGNPAPGPSPLPALALRTAFAPVARIVRWRAS
jgi:hypothetical protein